jgi:hypothetical protein
MIDELCLRTCWRCFSVSLGTQSQRFILNNYATTDKMASLCRAAIGASIVFGYPLTFITAREGILSALNIQEPTDTQVGYLYNVYYTHAEVV